MKMHSPTILFALTLTGALMPLVAIADEPLLLTEIPSEISDADLAAPLELEPSLTPEISESLDLGDRQTDASSAQQDFAVKLLSPTMDAVLESNSATVVVEAPIGSTIDLRVNGVAIDPNQIGQLETNAQTGTMRQLWYGVIFNEGDNTLSATATLNGATASTEINVQSPGAVAALRLSTIEKRVPADGRSTVTVEGFLLDERGHVSNRGGRVTLVPSSGEFIGVDAGPDTQGFQVDAREGKFTATLQSSLNSGMVQIRGDLSDLEAFTQVQFETALRPSLMTGVLDVRIGAENTDYFGSFSDFLNPDSDGGTEIDFNGAAFATGAIGDWLLTAALNYDRNLNETCETCTSRLYRADQNSERPYPTYGDESSLTNLTPSQDQFYFRLERSPNILGADPDYVMWGDYGTGQEFATGSQEFTALSRQLHGAKLNYNLGDLQISGLFARGGEAYQRDTILPDGTTGFYFLTQRLVIPGSEEVYFELEQLERPGTIMQRDRLQRGLDYDIDYDRGSIVFADPVLRTEIGEEGDVLVRRMVITYQHESGDDNQLYAGRLRYHFNREQNQASWLGATYFQDNQGDRDLTVYGADAQISFGENYKLVGEYARSSNDSSELGNVEGSAYRLDFNAKFSDSITGRAYYRHADTGFANRSTVSFVPGQTRYGADLDARLSPNTQLRFRYDHEDNNGVNIRPIISLGDLLAAEAEPIPESLVDSSLTTISAGILQKFGQANLSVDWIYRDRQDRLNADNSNSSSQLRSRFTTPLSQNVRVSLTNETTLSANTDAVYSDRTQASLDWRILPGLNLALNQNWYTRGLLAGQSTTSVNLGGEYRLWKNTVFTGRYSVENFSTGMQDTAAFGIKQRWTVLPGLHLDAAYERVIGNLFVGTDGAVGQGVARTAQTRSGDSLSLRASYTDNPNFKTQIQYEFRNTNDSRTSNISGSLLGKVSPSLTVLFDFDRRFAAGVANRGLPPSSNVRLGLAYRNPHSDRLNALLRYEYRRNPNTIPETLLLGSGTDSTEHLFAGEAIYSPNWQWEFYTKLGFRQSTINLADNFSASSTVGLAQFRTTYQLNRYVDLTGGIRWLGQPTANYSEVGWIGEVGFQATPGLRISAGYSSGEVNNDRDFSGSRSAGGFYFGAMLKLDHLFEGFGLQQPVAQAEVRRQLMVENPETDSTLQAIAPQPLRLDVSQTIDFQQESTTLSSEGQVVLDSLAMVMQQYRDLTLDIQGVLPPLAELTPDHLAAQRLQAARQYLLSQGISGDRIVIRSIGQSVGTALSQTQPKTPVTFALNAPSDTFQLLSAQLGDGGLVSNLLGQELPELATLPPLDETALNALQNRPQGDRPANGLTTIPWDEQPIANLSPDQAVPVRLPLLSFVPESDPATGRLTPAATSQNPAKPQTATTGFTFVPDWITGGASPATTESLAIAQRLASDGDESANEVETLQPSLSTQALLPTPEAQPFLSALKIDFSQIQTTDSRLPALNEGEFFLARNLTEPMYTSLLPTGATPNAVLGNSFLTSQGLPSNTSALNLRQARRLEAALSFLLSRDVDALNALLEATTGTRSPEVLGELVDLDQLMEQNSSNGGTL